MRHLSILLALLLTIGNGVLAAEPKPAPTIDPLQRTVDLNLGEQRTVTLSDGGKASVKLVALDETRDGLRNAVREARVTVQVNGRTITLRSANYQLPVTIAGVQIDCPVTRGYCKGSKGNAWALDADARLRLWPAGSPWIRPGTFAYPTVCRWFSSDTQMANEPTFVDGGEKPGQKSIYYHYGLDIGGSEGQIPILAATDGLVVSAAGEVVESEKLPPPVSPRYDVIYIRDARGWYYRYSHLQTIDEGVKPGVIVKRGRKLGLLGKEGGSGGWTHLHFDINAPQPSGRYGIVEGYAFYWQVYHGRRQTKLQAVARPHHLAWTGEKVVLDASRSFSSKGPRHIAEYAWTLGDGTSATGPQIDRRYDKAGAYSEILKITDKDGRVDYDFAVVQVVDRESPEQTPPTVHAVYWPTEHIKAGDEVTFKVRSFGIDADDGHEVWDFGDGSPNVKVHSDGNAVVHAKDGYAVTTHRYAKPGHYLVSVRRTNRLGLSGVARLHIRVAK